MANRYWVLGTGTWDATTTTNWSTSSGGTGGASAPTSADDVIFDSLSGAAPTVTIGTNAACGAVTITAPTSGTLTFAFSTTGVISYNGNWSSPASLFATTGAGPNAGAIIYVGSGSSTLTTNGYSFSTTFAINTSAGTLTLGGALTSSAGLTLSQGTFSTSASNYALTLNLIQAATASAKTISLNASTVTLSASSMFDFTAGTVTFNAGTSTINCSSSSVTFNGSGKTFSTVAFTSTVITSGAITGANTFTNLTFTTRSSNGISPFTLSANQTITGTLTLGATNTAVRRISIKTDTIGTVRTLTVATIATLSDVDFQDITAAGASGTWSGTRLGNCGNNSNITFVAGKTVYWNLAGTQGWSATGWATSSGGAPAINNFPLAQDTATFDNTGSVTGTITFNDSWNVGTVDMSTRTSAMTLGVANNIAVYGSWKNGTGTAFSGGATITFAGRSATQQITSNAIAFGSQPITVDNSTGTVQLQDALTNSTTTLLSGTLDLNNKTLTATSSFDSNVIAGTSRTLAFGTGNIICAGTSNAFTTTNSGGLTVTGTPIVNITNATATATSVAPGSLSEANSISFNFTGGTYLLNFMSGGQRVKNVDFTGFAGQWNPSGVSGTIYGNLKLSTGMSLTAGSSILTFGATSGTQTITSSTKTMDFPITVSGGSTVTCADALTLGSSRALTFSLGTLQLKSGVTNTVGSFVTSGTTLKYLQSTTSGTQATLSQASGTVTATYLSIQDSNATGGATFTATAATNVNAGNNTGWNFGVTPGNFFFMFN